MKGHPHKVDPSVDYTRKTWMRKVKLMGDISNNNLASIKQGIPIIPPRYIHVYLKGKEVEKCCNVCTMTRELKNIFFFCKMVK